MEDVIDIVAKAKSFAFDKHKNQTKKDKIISFSEHLEGVVNRLKNLGITNQEILSAAWLHDTIEHTDSTFDEINKKFGNTISVLVLSITKDSNLSNKEKEKQYIKQLKKASPQAKIIKLCDISANLKSIGVSPLSKTQKNKKVKKLFQYLRVIKKEISEERTNYPRIKELLDGINSIGSKFHQRPITI